EPMGEGHQRVDRALLLPVRLPVALERGGVAGEEIAAKGGDPARERDLDVADRSAGRDVEVVDPVFERDGVTANDDREEDEEQQEGEREQVEHAGAPHRWGNACGETGSGSLAPGTIRHGTSIGALQVGGCAACVTG